MPRGPNKEETKRRNEKYRSDMADHALRILGRTEANLQQVAEHIDVSPRYLQDVIESKRPRIRGGSLTRTRIQLLKNLNRDLDRKGVCQIIVGDPPRVIEARDKQAAKQSLTAFGFPKPKPASAPRALTQSVETSDVGGRRELDARRREKAELSDLFSGLLIGIIVGGSAVFIGYHAMGMLS